MVTVREITVVSVLFQVFRSFRTDVQLSSYNQIDAVQKSKGDTVVLHCMCMCLPTVERWRKEGSILTSGHTISTSTRWTDRLNISKDTNHGRYDLYIRNATLQDSGDYICEIQSSNNSFKKQITLTIIDLEESTTFAYALQTGQDVITDLNAITNRTDVVATIRTSNDDSYPQQITVYLIVVLGLLIVLLLSIACNTAIQKYRQNSIYVNTAGNQETGEYIPMNRPDEAMRGEASSIENIHYETIEDESSRQHDNQMRQQNLPLNITTQPSEDSNSRSTNSNNSNIDPVNIESPQDNKQRSLNNLNKLTS